MMNTVDISPLQCDKLMMNNTKVVHEIVMIPSVIGSGEYGIRCLKNKSILTTINLHDEKNIEFSGEITSKDIDVMDSIYTIYATGEKCFTLDQVVQVYTGDMNVKVTPKMRREVKKSIDKLMTTIVRIDCTEEFQNRKLIEKDDKMIFNSNILHLQYLEGKKAHFTANGRVSNSKIIYKFLGDEAPVLFQYAKAVGQIITVPMNLLTLDANTETSTEICRYVYRQIHYMKYAQTHLNSGRNNRISLYRYDVESKEYVGLMLLGNYSNTQTTYTRDEKGMIQRQQEIVYIRPLEHKVRAIVLLALSIIVAVIFVFKPFMSLIGALFAGLLENFISEDNLQNFINVLK